MKIQELYSYVCVKDAAKAIAFYQEAFGAKEKFRLTEPGGRIGHAELDFGCAILMLSDEFPEYGIQSPASSGGKKSFQIHLHVDDADAVIERLVKMGAEIVHPLTDQFYGERSGTVRDPFGHYWNVGHQLETVSPQEMQRRYSAMMQPTGTKK